MSERVLSPLGMNRARFFGHDVLLEPHAVGHATGRRGLQVARPWALPRACHPAGGVVTSTRELMAFANFHLEDGELRQTTRSVASTPHAATKPGGRSL